VPWPKGKPRSELCACGCGKSAPIATRTNTTYGWVKGRPKRFIQGHNSRGLNNPRSKPLADKFWSKVDKVNGTIPTHCPSLGKCWLWTAALVGRDGRGHIRVEGKYRYAHCVAFFLENGVWPLPQGLHYCDNPRCCRPSHVFAGTQQENIADMVRKGRQAGAKHNTNSRKLSDTQVLEVRKKSGQFSQKELAKQFNVSQGSISNIVTGNTWRRL